MKFSTFQEICLRMIIIGVCALMVILVVAMWADVYIEIRGHPGLCLFHPRPCTDLLIFIGR